MKVSYFWVAVAGATICGCKAGPVTTLHSAPAPQLVPGWISHPVAGEFTIAAPDAWTVNVRSVIMSGLPTLDSSGNLSMASAAPSEEVEPSDAERQKKSGELLVLYFKGAKPIPGEEMTRLFVKKSDSYGTLAATAKALKTDTGASDLKLVELPQGPAAVLKRTKTTIGGDVVLDIIYLVCHKDKAYRFTFETTNNAGPIDQDSDPVMKTLRISGI